jgi:tRNA(Ile)-lysidine synthase
MAAALLLQRLGAELELEVFACHFDHRLREGSKEEQQRVRALCEGLGMTCITGEGDVGAMAAERGLGVEEAARRMRYQFLAFAAGKERADVVATGHTADDQAETVLHHIIRGSGVRGIRGMLPRSPLPHAEAQVLIRPLLCLGRRDTEEICHAAGIEPVLDPSNEELEYTRNRIRHLALPALAKLNPGVRSALVRLSESAREAFDSIEKAAMGTQPEGRTAVGAVFALAKLEALPTEALALLVEREAVAAQLSYDVNATRLRNLRQALDGGRGTVRFGDAVVEVSNKRVRVGPEMAGTETFGSVVLNVPGVTRAGPYRVEVSSEPRSGWEAIGEPKGVLRARSAAAGDRVHRPDREVRLTRLFSDAGIPRWETEGALVVTDGPTVVAIPTLDTSPVPEAADPGLWLRAVRIDPA